MSDMTEAPSLEPLRSVAASDNFNLLAGVNLRLSVEVGSASLTLAQLVQLGEGSVVELDRQANDLLDIFANGTLLAKGEIVETGGRYGICIAEICSLPSLGQ